MSVKWISTPGTPRTEADRRICATSRDRSLAVLDDGSRTVFLCKTGNVALPAVLMLLANVCGRLRSCLSALLLFELLVEFELGVAFGLAARALVGARELEMHVGLVGRESGRGFEVLGRVLNVASLEQGLAEFVASFGEVGLCGDDLAKRAYAALGILA